MARLARLLLVVALLAAWQHAIVHPIEHLDEHGGFVHVGDGHSDDHGTAAGELCDLLAALGACAATVASPVPVVAVSQDPPQSAYVLLRAAQPPPFLSQGPPAVL